MGTAAATQNRLLLQPPYSSGVFALPRLVINIIESSLCVCFVLGLGLGWLLCVCVFVLALPRWLLCVCYCMCLHQW